MVDLSYPGRRQPTDPIHSAIAALSPGDMIQLQASNGRWDLCDDLGRIVGRLAKAFSPPTGLKCVAAHVAAVIQWRMKDGNEEYEKLLKSASWEVIIPEFIFSP
jgi:ATP-dependent DNA helicase RecQ